MEEEKVYHCETGVPCKHDSVAMKIIKHYKANYYAAAIYGVIVTAALIGVLLL